MALTRRDVVIIAGLVLFLAWPAKKGVELLMAKDWQAPTAWDEEFIQAEIRNGIPQGLLKRQAWQESRYNPAAVSPVGATGLMQFMPGTWGEWGGGKSILDPVAQINAAGRYMRWLYTQTGKWSLSLAAYNWGIGNVSRKVISAGVPLDSVAPAETRNYVKVILSPFAGSIS